MKFNLKEKCEAAKEKEFFYGAKINHDIQDAYLGLCFLDPEESNRKEGPGKGHEELLYIVEGQIQVQMKDETIVLNEGEILFLPDGLKVTLTNLSSNKSYFVIAGGHTKRHSHDH